MWERLGYKIPNPLSACRLERHSTNRITQQATSRDFPPQKTKGSLLGRLIEVWELLPADIKQESEKDKVDNKIKLWATKYFAQTALV